MERGPSEVVRAVEAAEGTKFKLDLTSGSDDLYRPSEAELKRDAFLAEFDPVSIEQKVEMLGEAMSRTEAEAELNDFLTRFNFEDADGGSQAFMLKIVLERLADGPNSKRFLAEAAAKRLHELEALNDYLREVRLPAGTKVSFQATHHV